MSGKRKYNTIRVENEKQFQKAIVDYARLNGWRVFHPYDSRRSVAGYPDLTMVRDDRLIFVELKTAKGRISLAQKEWASDLKQTCAEYYLWRPNDWDEIEKTLQRVFKKKV